jgi:hypothetical protein
MAAKKKAVAEVQEVVPAAQAVVVYPPEVVAVVEGLGPTTASFLEASFAPLFIRAREWEARAMSVSVTDASQVREMKLARENRLALRDIRLEAEKTRKELKEDSNRYGKGVQAMYNLIEAIIVPLEKKLEADEHFAEIQEAKRLDALRAERLEALSGLDGYFPLETKVQLMDEESFRLFVASARRLKADEDARAEAARVEAMREAEEAERLRQENARLRREAEAAELERQHIIEENRKREAALIAQQNAAEQKLKQEQAASLAKLQAIREAEAEAARAAAREEAARQRREEEERKKASAAPTVAKLEALAEMLENLELPTDIRPDGLYVVGEVKGLLLKIGGHIRKRCGEITARQAAE